MDNKFNIQPFDPAVHAVDHLFNQIMEQVSKNITNQKFRFRPEDSWWFYDTKVNAELSKYGWQVKSITEGGRDDGYTVWILSEK